MRKHLTGFLEMLIFPAFLFVFCGICSLFSCGTKNSPSDSNIEHDISVEGQCEEEATRCNGNIFQKCISAQWQDFENCTDSGYFCEPALGCVECIPLRPYCDGELLKQCTAEGKEGALIADCSAISGATCSSGAGACVTLCEKANDERSNVGCVYWAVDLDNATNSVDDAAAAQFAVVVANVHSTYTATVMVTMSESGYGNPPAPVMVETATVPPGTVHIFNLPRRDVDGPDSDLHTDDGPQSCLSSLAFKIESDIPIVAYQFNPITQDFSNDASLLIPESGMDTLHYVVVYPPANPIRIQGLMDYPNRDYVTVVGTRENTTVRVTPSYDIVASIPPIPAGYTATPAISAGETVEFTLGPYEVLNLETREMTGPRDQLPDLTGTVVDADKPIAVFTGVDLALAVEGLVPGCSNLEDCSCCAEHIEQQVIPKTSMGRKFVVTRSPMRNSGGWIEADVYRVMAVRNDTQITTNLTDPSLRSFTLNEMEWKEFTSKTGFILEASKPVHVVQFLVSQMQTENVIGDSSMVPFPSVEERRAYYVFTTGINFTQNYAVVSLPQGFDATIDGAQISSACGSPVTIGELDGYTYVAYTCEISEGAHVVDGGRQPVGVIVYGYYRAGSYAYPAGSDMRKIFVE